jgi:hypothetical protein
MQLSFDSAERALDIVRAARRVRENLQLHPRAG